MVPAILLLTFLGASAQAQTKIATVNLKTLFDNYYKTKLAQAAIQEDATKLDNDYRSMADDLKKGSAEYKKLLESANDQAVSDEERARRKQAAADKLKQLQDSQAAMEQFEREAQSQIADKRQRMRNDLLSEIKKFVADAAKAGGYTLVYDSAAQTIDETPVIVFNSGENDITDTVLKQMNAGAPLDLPQTTAPTTSFANTNSVPYNDLPDLPQSTSPTMP
jgi:outer membrane protein